MEFECKKLISIEDGKYTGTINKIEYRETPFAYTDVYVKVDDYDELTLKYGSPSSISENSKLGKLLKAFVDIEPSKSYDPEKILMNKKVSFLVSNETNEKGTFANIVPNSIKSL